MKNILTAVLLTLIFGITAVINGQTKPASATELKTVPQVDLKKYSGKWFEIARYPNKFQKQCVGNTTANYTVQTNNKIEVVNECLKKDGSTEQAKGEARIVDKNSNAKLEVRFAPKFLSFISAVWGDYWIIYLDDQYQNVAIGDPKRAYFWILSRQPEMNDATYQDILRKAEALGFSPAKVIKTPQNVQSVHGATVQKQ